MALDYFARFDESDSFSIKKAPKRDVIILYEFIHFNTAENHVGYRRKMRISRRIQERITHLQELQEAEFCKDAAYQEISAQYEEFGSTEWLLCNKTLKLMRASLENTAVQKYAQQIQALEERGLKIGQYPIVTRQLSEIATPGLLLLSTQEVPRDYDPNNDMQVHHLLRRHSRTVCDTSESYGTIHIFAGLYAGNTPYRIAQDICDCVSLDNLVIHSTGFHDAIHDEKYIVKEEKRKDIAKLILEYAEPEVVSCEILAGKRAGELHA